MPASITINTSGSQLTVIGTEHTLATVVTNGIFQLEVDLGPMAAGDVTEIRVYGKTLSGGTERLIGGPWVFVGAQSTPQVETDPIGSDQSWRPTIKQTAGTVRTYPWKVKQF
jgi:hypothetical protein